MKRLLKSVLIVLWLLFATHLYAYVWSENLDLFPQLPEEFGVWISYLTGMRNSEDVERLTLYYMLVVSFLAVSLPTFAVLFIWKRIRRGGVNRTRSRKNRIG